MHLAIFHFWPVVFPLSRHDYYYQHVVLGRAYLKEGYYTITYPVGLIITISFSGEFRFVECQLMALFVFLFVLLFLIPLGVCSHFIKLDTYHSFKDCRVNFFSSYM